MPRDCRASTSRGSCWRRYHQEVILEKAAEATLVAWDVLLPGRVSSGESFAYDVVCLATRAQDLEGRVLCQDVMLLEPRRITPMVTGVLGPYVALGALFVLSEAVRVSTLVDALASSLPSQRDVILGASALPNNSGAMVRVLGTTATRTLRALAAAWAAARQLLLGEGLPEQRKY